MGDEVINQVIETINELEQDSTIPKNVKSKLLGIKTILQGEDELSIKANRALSELDEISDDPNLLPYTRTAIWNITSNLEKA